MTSPWRTVDVVETDEGPMTLLARGEREFLIRMQGYVLMSSRYSRSEAALGRLVAESVAGRARPRVLIGGLGMGFTLAAALEALPAEASVLVAELNPDVVRWCEGPLAAANGNPLSDPRVKVWIGDAARPIADAAGRLWARWDGIALDLYQGTHDANRDPRHPFFGAAALKRTRSALAESGVLGVWTEVPDRGFEERAKNTGFTVERIPSGKGGPRYTVYLARR